MVAYKPKPGEELALRELTRTHVSLLRELGFATDRPSIACQAADGTVLEVFEWKTGALEKAHAHPRIQAMWQDYAKVCDYVPASQVDEMKQLFSSFSPMEGL